MMRMMIWGRREGEPRHGLLGKMLRMLRMLMKMMLLLRIGGIASRSLIAVETSASTSGGRLPLFFLLSIPLPMTTMTL